MRKAVVIIPAKNESLGIKVVIEELRSNGIRDIIVVDGSDDETAALARSLGATVVYEKRNGYGRAYMTGFSRLPKDADVVVCMDGDGTYPADAVPGLIDMLYDEDVDFISCAREYKSVMGLKHRFGNGVLTVFTNALFGTHMRDSQSGMWVFRRDVLDKVELRSRGMTFSEEFKIKVIRNGLRFMEVPTAYRERIGEAKLESYYDGVMNLLYLFKLRLEL
ncbi:MAG: glycosyltransferase family 2 protein [archaeon]